jgi:hypothetical protein
MRLLRSECASRSPNARGDSLALRIGASEGARETGEEHSSVLVVGADGGTRAKMMCQLRDLLPEGTPFAEAGETWEVVARAPASRMVVLTGDLRDLSARGLMRVLSRRHPLLPVIALAPHEGGALSSPLGAASL